MKAEAIAKAIAAELSGIIDSKGRATVYIDGRCASGKTTVAAMLSSVIKCNVFHMDDFFLRPSQRTPQRYAEPGGNADRERFDAEVLSLLKKDEPFSYTPFDCRTMGMKAPVTVTPCKINIVEGTYCCHPELWNGGDIHVFISTDGKTQLERIKSRGSDVNAFKSRWIPLEEKYFEAFNIEKSCELRFET